MDFFRLFVFIFAERQVHSLVGHIAQFSEVGSVHVPEQLPCILSRKATRFEGHRGSFNQYHVLPNEGSRACQSPQGFDGSSGLCPGLYPIHLPIFVRELYRVVQPGIRGCHGGKFAQSG